MRGLQLGADVEELELTGNRLDEGEAAVVLEEWAGAGLRLASLQLRKNLLEGAARLTACTACATLTALVLRDNMLKEVPPLAAMAQLRHLDVSYNEIRSTAPLAEAPACLEELFLARNKIRTIEGVASRERLRILELGSNRLRTMAGLENLSALVELWLGSNKITSIDEAVLRAMPKLRRLSVQANRLTSCVALKACALAGEGGSGAPLEELCLSQNGLTRLEGLEGLPVLLLDAADNPIESLDGLNRLPQLEDLWLNDTKVRVEALDSLAEALAASRQTLSTVYLERSPAAGSPLYQQRLIDALPALRQIDAQVLPRHGKRTAGS